MQFNKLINALAATLFVHCPCKSYKPDAGYVL